MMLGEKLYDICQPLFRSVSRVWCFEMLLWSWYIHATQNKNYQDHLMASKQQLRRCCAATSKLRIWVPLGQWVFCQLRRPRLMGCLGDAWDAHGMRPKFFSSQFHFAPPPSELGLSWIPSLQWSPAAVWRKDALSHHLESLVHTFSGPFSPAAHLAAFMCSLWTSMGEQLADHAQSQPETRHGSPSARTEIDARAIWVQQIRFELLRHIGTRQIVLRFCQGELVTKCHWGLFS